MAPKRGAASHKSSSPIKKAKVGHKAGNPDVEHVQDVLRNKTTDLPEVVRSMLIAMVPGSLGVATDERHEYQNAGVAMLEETLGEVKAHMKESIAAEDAHVADADSQKASLEATVEDAEARLDARQKVVEAKKVELTDAITKAKEAQTSCTRALKAQRDGDSLIDDVRAQRASIDELINGGFKAVKEGSWSTDKEVKKIVTDLNRFAKQISVDTSLLTALPAACSKKPEAQGAFDKMVISQLEESLNARLASLDSEIANATPASQERAAVVAAAETAFEAAKAAQQSCTAEVSQAESEEREAEAHVAETKKAKKDFGPAYRAATKVRGNLVALLAQFDEDLEIFARLKNQVSKRRQRQLDAEAAAAEATEEQGDDTEVAAEKIAGDL